jgi:hypothetical protein
LARRTPKSAIVALKVDPETAAMLDALPNKSEFIRAALRARLDEVCPVCRGSGLRPDAPVAHAPGGRHLHALPRLRCGDCGRESPVVTSDLEDAERAALVREVRRLRTFLGDGDYFCTACFGRSVPCERCGHRIAGTGSARTEHVCGA